MPEIAAELEMSKGSVSHWTRDVEFVPRRGRALPRTVWLRRFFEIDESRLRVQLYLHQGLDLAEAVTFWSQHS